jgi:hypothetical protein
MSIFDKLKGKFKTESSENQTKKDRLMEELILKHHKWYYINYGEVPENAMAEWIIMVKDLDEKTIKDLSKHDQARINFLEAAKEIFR